MYDPECISDWLCEKMPHTIDVTVVFVTYIYLPRVYFL